MGNSEMKNKCPICHGKGTVLDTVRWSDGLGHVDAHCQLCDRTGKIDDIVSMALNYKKKAESAQAELSGLRIPFIFVF